MRKSLLQIVQAVTGELKIGVTPTVVISSTDSEVQLIRSLVIAACDELTQDYDWEELMYIGSFTLVEGQTAYPQPSDFVRMMDNTMWNEAQHLRILGPQSAETWARLTRGVVNSGPRYQFRLQGNNFNFIPVPGNSGDVIQYDYISSQYVIDAGTGAAKRDFESDADRTFFGDRLLIDCVKLKYLETNGFDSSAVYSDFMRSLASTRSANQAGGTLSLLGAQGERLIDTYNLPDGSYGNGGAI